MVNSIWSRTRSAIDFDPSKAPARRKNQAVSEQDVVEAMFNINRQINPLLERRYLPEDVYERLDLTTTYVAGVLKQHDLELFPKVEFVPRKQPGDVYLKLLDCLELNEEIGRRLNIPVLEINRRRMADSYSELSNNYDLATLLVADVARWTEALEGAEDVFPEEYELNHVFPSNVYQKASQLEAQLKAVLEQIERKGSG